MSCGITEHAALTRCLLSEIYVCVTPAQVPDSHDGHYCQGPPAAESKLALAGAHDADGNHSADS